MKDRGNHGGYQVSMGECCVCGNWFELTKIGTLRGHVNWPERNQRHAAGSP